MKVSWEVEDGYVGKSRTHETKIPNDEIADCDSIEEAIDLITEFIQNDFEQSITWCFRGYESMIDEVKELLKSKQEG